MKKIAIGICADCPLECKLRAPAGRIPLECPLPNAGPGDYGYVGEGKGTSETHVPTEEKSGPEGTSEKHIPTGEKGS